MSKFMKFLFTLFIIAAIGACVAIAVILIIEGPKNSDFASIDYKGIYNLAFNSVVDGVKHFNDFWTIKGLLIMYIGVAVFAVFFIIMLFKSIFTGHILGFIPAALLVAGAAVAGVLGWMFFDSSLASVSENMGKLRYLPLAKAQLLSYIGFGGAGAGLLGFLVSFGVFKRRHR